MPRGVKGSGSIAKAAPGGSSVLSTLRQARAQLVNEQTGLQKKLAALDATIAAFGGNGVSYGAMPGPAARMGRKGGRGAYRRGSLKECIDGVMAGGEPMEVKEVHAAVLKAGFRSKNKTLAKSIGIALSQMPTVVKVSRGVFRAKG